MNAAKPGDLSEVKKHNNKALKMFKILDCNSGNPDNWPSDLFEPETRKEFDERVGCIKKHMGRYRVEVK